MKSSRLLFAAATAATFGMAHAQSTAETAANSAPAASAPDSDLRYAKRIDARYADFAGSSENLKSLAVGLRHGSEIELSGSGETVRFTSPTRPMGYGNITRALDFASRDLAAAGIGDPTPSEIQAALTGGTVSTPTGEVTFSGVLELRSQGMGWGQIAHAIGVQPGLGSGRPLPATASGASGITTAVGTSVAASGAKAGHGAQSALSPGHGGAITNAAGGAESSSAAALREFKGQGHANAFGKPAGRL
jgi:hypothetical protein